MPDVQTTKIFMVSKKTTQSYCVNGFKKSSRESAHKSLRKQFSRHAKYTMPDNLPSKVDLRPWMTPVEEQADLSTCVVNALAGIYEYLIKRTTNKHIDVSRLFIYYNARKKDIISGNSKSKRITDMGATITSTIDTLKELGICLESIWPYKRKYVNLKPSPQSYKEAKQSTITEAMSVPVDLHMMKACLAQGFPFVFGLQLYESFNKAELNGGEVPMPETSMNIRNSHNLHAMLAVGYSELSQAFIVRNSWGEKWGEKGYCYIPYEYMTHEALCSDIYIIKNISSNLLGVTEDHIQQDTINYLGHRYRLAPEAYSDDNVGAKFMPFIVNERIYPAYDAVPYGEGGYRDYGYGGGAEGYSHGDRREHGNGNYSQDDWGTGADNGNYSQDDWGTGGGNGNYSQDDWGTGADNGNYSQDDWGTGGDNGNYSQDDQRAGGDNGNYSQDDQRAGGDNGNYSQDGQRAGGDNGNYSQDGQRAGGDNGNYSQDGQRAGGDNGNYSQDDQRAGGDNGNYSQDGQRAGGDNGNYSQDDRGAGGDNGNYSTRSSGVPGEDYRQIGTQPYSGPYGPIGAQPHSGPYGPISTQPYSRPYGPISTQPYSRPYGPIGTQPYSGRYGPSVTQLYPRPYDPYFAQLYPRPYDPYFAQPYPQPYQAFEDNGGGFFARLWEKIRLFFAKILAFFNRKK